MKPLHTSKYGSDVTLILVFLNNSHEIGILTIEPNSRPMKKGTPTTTRAYAMNAFIVRDSERRGIELF